MRFKCPEDNKGCYVQYTTSGFRYKCRHQNFTMDSYACEPMIKYWNKKLQSNLTIEKEKETEK